MQKIRLLFVMATLGRGGAERSLINLLGLLDEKKYEIDLLVFNTESALMPQIPTYVNVLNPGREIGFLISDDKKVMLHCASFKGILARIRYMLKRNKNANNYVRSQQKWEYAFKPTVPIMSKQYDVAIAYMHSLPSYYVIDKTVARKKIIWVHNDYSSLLDGKNFDRSYFKKANTVVTISSQCVEELKRAFPDMADKFVCIYNLNPEDKIREKANAFDPEEYKTLKCPVIVSVGRLNKQKGFDMAIDAAAMMKRKGFSFRWFIIGEGELKSKLAEQIKRQDVTDCVILLGARENPYPYMKHATVVAQTSRYEGKSIVLDEAKILRKPILTTDYLSVHDQIDNNVTGVIVSIASKEIAEGLIELCNDVEKQKQLISNLWAQKDNTYEILNEYEEVFAE